MGQENSVIRVIPFLENVSATVKSVLANQDDHAEKFQSQYKESANNLPIKDLSSKRKMIKKHTITKQELKIIATHTKKIKSICHPSKYGGTEQLQKPLQEKITSYKYRSKNAPLISLSQSDVKCPVCLQILIDPAQTSCGHLFCFKCLQESSFFCGFCPVCRCKIKGSEFYRCFVLQNLLENHFSKIKNFSSSSVDAAESHRTYLQRLQLMKKWRQNRDIQWKSISVGDKIDACDSHQIWCSAIVKQVLFRNEILSQVLVHYEKWNEIFDQVICLPSLRVAKLGFYSSRTKLSKYSTDASQNEQLEASEGSGQSIGASFLHQLFSHNLSSISQFKSQEQTDKGCQTNDPSKSISEDVHRINRNFDREIQLIQSRSGTGEASGASDESLPLSQQILLSNLKQQKHDRMTKQKYYPLQMHSSSNDSQDQQRVRAHRYEKHLDSAQMKFEPQYNFCSNISNGIENFSSYEGSNEESNVNGEVYVDNIEFSQLDNILCDKNNKTNIFLVPGLNKGADKQFLSSGAQVKPSNSESESLQMHAGSVIQESDESQWEIKEKKEDREQIFTTASQRMGNLQSKNRNFVNQTLQWHKNKPRSQGSALRVPNTEYTLISQREAFSEQSVSAQKSIFLQKLKNHQLQSHYYQCEQNQRVPTKTNINSGYQKLELIKHVHRQNQYMKRENNFISEGQNSSFQIIEDPEQIQKKELSAKCFKKKIRKEANHHINDSNKVSHRPVHSLNLDRIHQNLSNLYLRQGKFIEQEAYNEKSSQKSQKKTKGHHFPSEQALNMIFLRKKETNVNNQSCALSYRQEHGSVYELSEQKFQNRVENGNNPMKIENRFKSQYLQKEQQSTGLNTNSSQESSFPLNSRSGKSDSRSDSHADSDQTLYCKKSIPQNESEASQNSKNSLSKHKSCSLKSEISSNHRQ